MFQQLKVVLHRELHDARIARRRDAPEGRSRKRCVRVIQQEPVERVEGLEPRLEAMTVGEPEQAYERQIDDVTRKSRSIEKQLNKVEALPSNPQPLLPELLPSDDDE